MLYSTYAGREDPDTRKSVITVTGTLSLTWLFCKHQGRGALFSSAEVFEYLHAYFQAYIILYQYQFTCWLYLKISFTCFLVGTTDCQEEFIVAEEFILVGFGGLQENTDLDLKVAIIHRHSSKYYT